MGYFHYRALSASGRRFTGSLEATDLAAAERSLRDAGVWMLEATEGAAVTRTEISRLKVRRSEIIAFLVQMSLLLRAGITLPVALQRLGDDFKGSKVGEVVESLREKVTVGTPLHQAMQGYPRVFAPEVVAIVQAGEASGRLPEIFESLTEYFEWLDGLMGDIRQALIYPLMVAGAASALVLLLFTLVVPKFVGLLNDLSLQVPLLTRLVMAVSNLLLHYWPLLLAVGFAVPAALAVALRVPRFGRAFDRALMQLPIFGSLVTMFALSRFTRNLGMLYHAGIPLLRGLEICRNVVGNRALAFAVDAARGNVLEGIALSKALAAQEIFPPTLITMIATGESSGTLDVALQNVTTYYNKIIPRRIKIVFAVFDPVMMVTLVTVVGVVALAVILPILQLWNAR